MRSRLFCAVAVVLAIAAGGVVGAPPATAVTLEITAVALDAGPVVVTGLTGTASAAVSVSVTSSPPVAECTSDPSSLESGHVVATLVRIAGGALAYVHLPLDLISGSTTLGTWSTTWRIGAGRAGTWQMTGVDWCTGTALSWDEGYHGDPRVTPGYRGTLVVQATAPPRVTLQRIPRISAYSGRQWVRATYASSVGVPMVGRAVTYGSGFNCGTRAVGGSMIPLDASGSVTVRLAPQERSTFQCLLLTEPEVTWVTPSTTVITEDLLSRYTYYRTVTAKAATSRFRIGTPARVRITVYPVDGQVRLQVLAGRTWRTLTTHVAWGSVHVPAGVRASLVRGRHLYRVQAFVPGSSGAAGLAPTTSKPFVMTGV